MISTLVLAVILVILLILSQHISRWSYKNLPPGPVPWPFIGNQFLVRRLTRKLGSQHLAFEELNRKYKSNVITLRLGGNDVVVVAGVTAVLKVFNSEKFDGRPWNEFNRLRNMGMRKGITMNDGAEWKEVRSWVVRTLRTVGFGQEAMTELIRDELLLIINNMKDGGVKCLKDIISPAVINVLWTLSTGTRIEGTKLQYLIELMERRSRAFDMTGGILSTFPWLCFIAPEMSGYNVLVNLNSELRAFLMETINEHKKKYVAGSESDLIDMFLREMYEEKESNSPKIFTDEQLVLILVDLFLAGITTTMTVLDFLFLHMVVHQDVQRKVKEEISTVISSENYPNLQYRSKLPYTEAVFTEVQRIKGILPIIGPRRVVEDTTIENYSLPKDITILINLYTIHMDPNLFPQPDEFRPERFFKDGVYQSDENILTFGRGKRRCPGEALARTALFMLFTGVMQKFTLLPVPNVGPWSIETISGLVTTPKPYKVLVVPS